MKIELMLILNLSTQDFAGIGHRRCEALRIHFGVEAYSVITKESYMRFPYHLKLGLNATTEMLQEIIAKADVIHVNEVSFRDSKQVWFGEPGVSIAGRFPIAFPFDLEATDKVIIREQHSIPSMYTTEAFRAQYSPDAYNDLMLELDHLAASGGGLLASNFEILSMHKAMRYLGKPVGLDEIRSLREYYPRSWKEDDTLYVVQTVTLSGLVEKHTSLLTRACKNLRRKGLNVRASIIKNQPHRISLMAKALSDVGFGHLRGFLDVSILESMAMGKPTIAFAGPALQEWLAREGGLTDYMPIVNCAANLESVEGALSRLYSDEGFYENKGHEAERFINRFHDEKKISEQYLEWVEELRKAKDR